MARLREGRANTARGAAHFLRETMGRVRYAGATGLLTVRADSGCYNHAMVSTCRQLDVRFSITIRQHQSRRNQIEAIPEGDWTPLPYWMDGAADVAETTYIPFESAPDAAPVRRIVRRVQPTPGSQLALLVDYSYHGFITDRDGGTLELEALWNWRPIIAATPRSRTPSATSSTAWGSTISPQGVSPPSPLAIYGLAGGPGDGPQPGPLGCAHRSGRATGDHQDPPAAVLLPCRTAHPLGPPPHPASSPALALGNPIHSRPGPIPRHSSTSLSSLTARRRRPTRPPDNPGAVPQIHASPVRECRFWHPAWPISPTAPPRDAALPPAWPPRTTLNPICRNQAWSVRLPVPIIPRVNASTVSLRWIRVKDEPRHHVNKVRHMPQNHTVRQISGHTCQHQPERDLAHHPSFRARPVESKQQRNPTRRHPNQNQRMAAEQVHSIAGIRHMRQAEEPVGRP